MAQLELIEAIEKRLWGAADMSWLVVQLGDFITLKRGYDLPEKKRISGEISVISSSGITGTHNVAKINGPGVVTGRYGTIGEVFYTENAFLPLNTALYVQNFKGNYPRFVSYFLKNVLSKIQSDKAAVPGVNRNDLHARKVSIPESFIEQQKIADILSAYDNLIENNRRRIQLLEESARLLYEEWFVRLRFPGHEHVKIVDGIPEGWERKELSQLAMIVMGQSPKSKFYNTEGVGLPFHQGVKDFGSRFPTNETYCTEKNKLAEAGDILFSVRAPVGRINISTEKIVIGRGLAAIRSTCNQQSFLLYTLKNFFYKEDIIGSGSIYASVTKKDVHNVILIQPNSRVIDMFLEQANYIDQQILTLSTQIRHLVQARDLFLPKLMNGEIKV